MFEIHGGLVANGTILFTRQIGVHTQPELRLGILRVVSTFKDHPLLPEIVDLSAIRDSELNFRTSNALVDTILPHIEPPRTSPKKRIAMYAPSGTMFGMARIYASLLEAKDTNIECMVCRTEAEALAYLDRPETGFAELEGFDRVGPLPPLESASGL
ncbi:hypothetical protein [Tropicibacter sp. S64]|uniref:hypothetical protein n=1 Tax=Tropicibacter sp. S64 TaxID=3415122 RepID=UPI003C7A773A